MGNNNKRSHFWSIVVIGVVLGVYAFGAAIGAMNAREAGVMYKREQGVALECVVTWDASGLSPLMDKAVELNVPLTFFMTADFAKNHGERVDAMQDAGFEIGLLCSSVDALWADVAGMRNSGVSVAYVMPDGGVNTSVLEAAATELGMTTVLCTFDLKNTTTDPAALVKRVSESAFDGAIIRFQPAKTTVDAFSGIVDALRQMGLTIQRLAGEHE